MASRKKHVTLTVTAPLLEGLLRLDDTMHIVGAEYDPDTKCVTFTVRAPNAPNSAYAMVPEYSNNGRPDPVALTAVDWLLPNDGMARTEICRPDEPEKEAA